MMSYRAVQSFDHTISQKGHGHGNMLSPNTYPYISRSDDNDSIDELVKIFSIVHSCFGQRLLESSSYEIT